MTGISDTLDEEWKLRESFKGALFESTNFTIVVGNHKWRVHSRVLSRHSDFFDIACKEGAWKEGVDRKIELHEEIPIAFARFLQYCYYGTYCYDVNTAPVIMSTSAQVYGPTLHQLLEKESCNSVFSFGSQDPMLNGDPAAQAAIDVAMYQLADKYCARLFKASTLNKFKDFEPKSAGNLYTGILAYINGTQAIDSSLKAAIAPKVASHYQAIKKRGNNSTRKLYEWLLADSELCRMVMDALGDLNEGLRKQIHG